MVICGRISWFMPMRGRGCGGYEKGLFPIYIYTIKIFALEFSSPIWEALVENLSRLSGVPFVCGFFSTFLVPLDAKLISDVEN